MRHTVPRPISNAELAVLQAAIAEAPTADMPDVLGVALEELLVYSHCDCGCASVGFLPKEMRPSASTRPIADGLALSPAKRRVRIVVHGSPGRISELEVYWFQDGGAPLPRPETVVPWERGAEFEDAVD